jgi:ankyrin repeat protein
MAVRSLPSRPNLDQLRNQAKELKDAARAGDAGALERLRPYVSTGTPATLSAAQRAIAHEYGFASWPKLKAAVESRTMDLAQQVDAFLRASVGGPEHRAVQLLERNPEIAEYDFRTAVVLGDAARVREFLVHEPELAVRPAAPAGWPPLLGVCSSRWHRIDPSRAAGLLEVARILLNAGADPRTRVENIGQRPRCSTLFGAAGTANNPGITQLLLERGAVPDDETLYLAAFFPDHECLRLLLSQAVALDLTSALAAPISIGDIEGVRLLLEAGADPTRPFQADLLGASREADPPIGAVAAAIECDCSAELIALLLKHGGDPNAPGRDGSSPVRLATRRGRTDVAELLARYGANDRATEVDRFLAACIHADRDQARRLLGDHPDLLGRLSDEDRGSMIAAAGYGDIEAVRLMLELGFPVTTRAGEHGCTALHAAALSGSAELIRLLIDAGADLEARDATWNSTPLDWAVVGSGLGRGDANSRHNPHADFVATVRTLIDAGASLEDIRPSPDKPPSSDVLALLLSYGVPSSID